jgi:dihydroorotate dehydrogenase electron transfer subunit
MSLRPYNVARNARRGPYATLALAGDFDPSAPGQFYMLKGEWGSDPMLGRPLSVLGESPGEVRFLLKVVGEGTRRLHALEPGARVFGLGPLGRPFPVPEADAPRSIFVGGGVGVPPLVYLAERFSREGLPFVFLQGARTGEDLLLLEELAALGAAPILTTEDGSEGARGLVTAPLEAELAKGPATVYACGPEGMLKAVAGLCEGRAPSFLSLEARMGCGYGVCLGCVVPVKRDGRRVYERVCKEGPVFEGEVVLWA